MLEKANLGGRSYERIYDEAQKLIPAYTGEWTNWNLSDPGITILQSLAFLSAKLDEKAEATSDADMAKLLAVFGFPPTFAMPARLNLFLLLRKRELLPAGAPFLLRGLQFELAEETGVQAGGITAVWYEQGEKRLDVSGLVYAKSRLTLFEDDNGCPAIINIIFSYGARQGEKLRVYVEADSKFPRNKADGGGLAFAVISWEALCAGGFAVCEALDHTFCFTQSGFVEITVPNDMVSKDGGYYVRAVVSHNEYDILPRIGRIWGGHAELLQVQTLSRCVSFDTAEAASLTLPLRFWGVESADLLVLGRDESGGFRRYRTGSNEPRSYALINKNGVYFVRICCEKMPCAGTDAVRVLIRRPETISTLELGSVAGYDGQSFSPAWPDGDYPTEGARLMLKQKYGKKTVYEDVDSAECGVYCSIATSGAVTVERAATDGDNALFFAQLALTRGESGNLLKASLGGCGTGGVGGRNPGGTAGSLASLNEEFARPRVAVTAQDYERIALETPGLSLEAASAKKYEDGAVQVAVKPYSDKQCPGLSALQSQAIQKHLEDNRILNAKIKIIPPKWVPVEIAIDVLVYPQAVSAKSQIENAIKTGVRWGEFGASVSYGKVHALLDALACVESVPHLKIRAGSSLGDNIRRDFTTIFYLKSMQINCETRV